LESRPFKTKDGQKITISPFSEEAIEGLILFYEQFEPKEVYQGLPPRLEGRRRPWAENLVHGNITLLAMDGGQVIGQISAIPIPSSLRAELLIFVHQDFQNQGIGTELIRSMTQRTAEVGVKSLWLTVQTSNSIAVHVLQKCGFRFIGPMNSEREMILDFGSWEGS
jgi:RimJ/RimL family protein N-acetyltransferase